jgi:hypothetical protein
MPGYTPHGSTVEDEERKLLFLMEGAYAPQGRAHSRRLHPDEAARTAAASTWSLPSLPKMEESFAS